MVVSTNPGLVELDVGISGAASIHVHDFWRPLGLREAQVDDHYSVQCYLDAVATAYLGLAGLLHAQAASLIGERIGLFSYGSGCTSEFFSGVVAERAAEQIAAAGIAELLAARERISIAEYERIMALPATAPLLRRNGHEFDGNFRFLGVTNHQRQYASR